MKPYSSARDEFQGNASVFLDANENPFNRPYNRYPDPLQWELKKKIAEIKGVKRESIFLGNGSDEPIDLDVYKRQPLVTLYTTPNPLNDIFTLNISYGIGALEQPELMQLTNYLQLLGTESLSFEQFRSRLQSIGSTLAFDVTPDAFVMKVTGFDNHIDAVSYTHLIRSYRSYGRSSSDA